MYADNMHDLKNLITEIRNMSTKFNNFSQRFEKIITEKNSRLNFIDFIFFTEIMKLITTRRLQSGL